MCTQNASIQTTAAHGQRDRDIGLQPLPVLAAPGMTDPNSDDSEEPDPLAFSTGDPDSEPDAVVTGLPDNDDDGVVEAGAGLYPTVELDDDDEDAKTQLPELGLALTSIAVPPKSQLEGAGFLW